jgi:hypothetical protein
MLWGSENNGLPPFGRELFHGLKARAEEDVRDLVSGNATLKAARYSWPVRHFRKWITGTSLGGWLATYVAAAIIVMCMEALMKHYIPAWTVLPSNTPDSDLFRDIAGYFITAQVGLLAVLTVAVSVVTLLSEKDEGVSQNTDVRLYYVQSYTGEVSTSGVALLIVLVVQVFWPLLNIIHSIFPAVDEQSTERALTASHGVWLVLNLALFLRFIRTTLDFVVAGNRAQMRKRYVATEIVPASVFARLFAVYLQAIPTQILGKLAVDDGPYVTAGTGLIEPEQSSTVLQVEIAAPAVVSDVFLRPLGWVIRRWYRRSLEPAGTGHQRRRTIHLALPMATGATFTGRTDLLLQNGGAPITRLEQWLVRRSFRLKPIRRGTQSQPTPNEFIEQLVSNIVRATVARATNAFDDAVSETVDFHQFLLEVHNTRDERGDKVNLADFADGFFNRPAQTWANEYRRAHIAAADEIATSTYFVNGLNYVPLRLWPRSAREFPDSVLGLILDLGRHQVVAFESWFTKRAAMTKTGDDRSLGLAGSDLRGYDSALINFVSTWEGFGTIITNSFGLSGAGRDGSEAYWSVVGALWPSLWVHLRNAAYFLASAVWNDDDIGEARFRDLLLRWLHVFYRELDNEYLLRDGLVLSPDVLRMSIAEAQEAMRRIVLFPTDDIAPRSIFGVVLREAHHDIVVITSAIFANWHATGRQPSPLAARAASKLLNREVLQEGTNLAAERGAEPKTVFRAVFDTLIRQAVHPRFQETRYAGYLDALIQELNSLASRRMVPGRIYSGVGLDGFDTLTPEMLAMMAANLPASGDDGAAEMFSRLLDNEPLFASDSILRDFDHHLSQQSAMLDGEGDERFETTMRLYRKSPDTPGCRARLKAVFDALLVMLKAKRASRIQTAPLDVQRMKSVIDTVSNDLLGGTQPIGAFAPCVVQKVNCGIDQKERTYGTFERGFFTDPPMSPIEFDEIPPIISQMTMGDLRQFLLWELSHQPNEDVLVTTGHDVVAFFKQAISILDAVGLGTGSVLLVPSQPFGIAVSMASQGFPEADLEDLAFTRDPTYAGDHGYFGSIDGIPIFDGYTDVAVCCSRTYLRGIEFADVHGTTEIFDFEPFDDGDPQVGRIRTWIAYRAEWEQTKILWFRFVPSLD